MSNQYKQPQAHHSEILLKTIFDTAINGIIIIDEKGIIEMYNPTAEKIFGYPVNRVIGQNIKMLMPEAFKARHDHCLNHYVQTGESRIIGVSHEVQGRRNSGEIFPMELTIREMWVDDRRLFTGLLRDITYRKNAEQALRDSEVRLRAIIDTVADGIITIDSQGLIETYNPAAEKIFGYPFAEVAGQHVRMLLPDYLQDKIDRFLDNNQTNENDEKVDVTREIEGRRKDGSMFSMELVISEMVVNDKRMLTNVVRDITERTQADRMKREFVSIVSHELRTPLTSIKGSLGLVKAGVAGKLPDKMKQMFEIAYNNSDRLVRLINDILDIEKIEAGKMDFLMAPIDLNKLVAETIEANKAYAKEYKVSLKLVAQPEQAMVYGDADRLTQVITNLLSNASKFSNENGAVEVSTTVQSNDYCIAITDHGAGIPDEFVDKIFAKFSQADSSDTRAKGGTGLGLSITKAIIERHDGHIRFESTVGQGTTFFITLPIYKKPGELGQVTKEDEDNGETYKILICEDDDSTATLLQMMLKETGFSSDIAYTAAQAEKMLARHTYDAMTLDLRLPDKNGITLMKELREQPEYEDLLIIVVSAIAEKEKHELNGNAIGVLDWISKPIDHKRLSSALFRIINQAGSSKPHILHVEDDQDIVDVIQSLIGDLAEITTAKTLSQAISCAQKAQYDLVILDLSLPDGNGEEILSELKNSQGESTPVIVFSAKDATDELTKSIDSVLVKSRTTNALLLKKILSVIKTNRLSKKNKQ